MDIVPWAVTWDLEQEAQGWNVLRRVGSHEEVVGSVQMVQGGFLGAFIDSDPEWIGPVRGSRRRALRDVARRTF